MSEKELDFAKEMAIRAAKSVAPRFEKGREAWRNCVGHIMVTLLERHKKLKSCEDLERWVRATSYGEAKKYYRIEHRDRLGF